MKRLSLAAHFCVFLLVLPLLAHAAPAAARQDAPDPAPLLEGDVFDMAFEFASAIETDPVDKALSQSWVIRDLRIIKQFDRAAAMADRATGWDRGMELAELSKDFALEGRPEDASKAARAAALVASQFNDWRALRIKARLARTDAYLGLAERAESVAKQHAKLDEHLGGISARTLAAIAVVRQDYDKAFEVLGDASDPSDVYVTGARVLAYLDMIDMESVPPEVKLRAAHSIRESLEAIDNARYVAEVYPELAKRYRLLGHPLLARKALVEAEAAIDKLSAKFETKPMCLLKTAREWGNLGETGRSVDLLVQAETIVPQSLNIEQPSLYAVLASGYQTIGDTSEAERLYAKGLDLAAELINSRPRCLQMVKILGAMGRSGFVPDPETRRKISQIHADLGHPW